MRVLKNSYSTPLIPQSWGNFESGGHPQTLGRKVPAPLFQHSLNITLIVTYHLSGILIEILIEKN
jgi:hypothetical protein